VVVLFGPVVVLSVPNEPSGNRLGSIVGGVIVPAGCVVPAVGAIKLLEAAGEVVVLLPVSDA
jgi:hypothetical protein